MIHSDSTGTVERPLLFELQGHRGARGLKPENTLPSFEVALDVGVTSIETDIHLTRDGVPVLVHDPQLSDKLYSLTKGDGSFSPADHPQIRSLTLNQLRQGRADRNPDPRHFPRQDASVTPLARWFADQRGFDPYTSPTLADLFSFVDDYAGPPGAALGKSDAQRANAARLRFDLELKRVPFRPELVNDGYTGEAPALFERQIVAAVRQANVALRTVVRSFDNRCVKFLRQMEPGLTGAALMRYTTPVTPGDIARGAGASIYCPNYVFLDASQVQAAHAAGLRVLPWTVNERSDWEKLVAWGVDGITTDYPDQLAKWLCDRGIAF
jgi:glycerophosphoryl diester phosphodiesterase